MNRLSGERSAYLKHAAHQKIDWHPWSDEVFEKARRENKPVFLSTGAVWCHWCHVMAKECFENEEVASLLNEHFISIKLDRDERPEIDRRYQKAVIAMGSPGGWPLNVFLTPEKKPFFGGTYFPPDDLQGRPGFRRVLRSVVEFYHSNGIRVNEFSDRVMDFLGEAPMTSGEIGSSLLDNAVRDILSEYDAQNGGFGSMPKFPMPGATEFLMRRHFFTGNRSAGLAVRKTLEAMAKGGFHDQLGGGFHRYSVDEGWIVPHFEKMADDNSWLLRNYVDAYALFGDGYFRDIAKGITGFFRDVLSDPEGGFYASQDADVTPDDEGGYFTWREDDFRKALNDEEYRVLSLHLLHERGEMHHDPSKKVLFIAAGLEEVAEKTGMDPEEVKAILQKGKEKLLIERKGRETPFIDNAFYTSLNGMVITSCLKAYRVMRDVDIRDLALRGLERVSSVNLTGGVLMHSEGVEALLDDYVFLAEAYMEAYEATGRASYLEKAEGLMERCIERFWDDAEGGFFDASREVLGIRLKGIEDIPHPSANSVAFGLLEKLASMKEKEVYRLYAEKGLKAFSSRAGELGIHGGAYFCALDDFIHSLTLSVNVPVESELAETALSLFRPSMHIRYGKDEGFVVPCEKGACYNPVHDTDSLKEFLKSHGLQG
jgi:uncharacterized protein YyaL (SSP411 family)